MAQYITKHFTWEEAHCNDGTKVPAGLMENVVQAAYLMEVIRRVLGNKPIVPHSWYRTPTYNKTIGGASNSQHLQGKAVDFTCKHLTPKQVQAIMKKFHEAKVIGGLGNYAGFTHVDIGPWRVPWNG